MAKVEPLYASGQWSGVSQPPSRWHTGPGVRLNPGDAVWFVLATDWPTYTVASGTFVTMIAQRLPEKVARLAIAKGQGLEVVSARLFVSRQLAQAEAQILMDFASSIPPSLEQRKIELHEKRQT